MHWLTRPGGTPTGMPPPAPFFLLLINRRLERGAGAGVPAAGHVAGPGCGLRGAVGSMLFASTLGPAAYARAPYWPRSACSASASSSTSCRTRASSGSWAGAPSSCARSSSRGSSASGNPRTHWGSRASCGPYSRSRTRSISIPSLLDLLLCRRRCARV
jgi:hypothetical protein